MIFYSLITYANTSIRLSSEFMVVLLCIMQTTQSDDTCHTAHVINLDLHSCLLYTCDKKILTYRENQSTNIEPRGVYLFTVYVNVLAIWKLYLGLLFSYHNHFDRCLITSSELELPYSQRDHKYVTYKKLFNHIVQHI